MRDLVIIGAGPGGYDAAIYAKEHDLDVLLIEKETVGGTCLNWGCIPTKALYHNSLKWKELKEINEFGISIENPSLDFSMIKKRKERIVSSQVSNIESTLEKLHIDFIQGEANILEKNMVVVGENTILTKNIIIATGSSPRVFPFDGIHLPIVHDSKGLLSLNKIPKKLLVVGAGVIGIEMATIFAGFGTEVTIIEYAEQILPALDKDISKRAQTLIKRSGVTIFTSSTLRKLYEEDRTYYAKINSKKGEIVIETDYVLIATGRKPNFGNLPLKELGIHFDSSGIFVDSHKQTNVTGIYAIGDVNGELMLAHKATYDGYKAVSHILGNHYPIRFDLVPSVIFGVPEIATVGKTEKQLVKDEYRVSKFMYRTNAKADCMNETDGFIKIIVDNNDLLIGCQIIGPHASDLIHEVTGMMSRNSTLTEYLNVIHAHPTLSEVIGECLKKF
jgi:dihydrolipoamide dehydrogenase